MPVKKTTVQRDAEVLINRKPKLLPRKTKATTRAGEDLTTRRRSQAFKHNWEEARDMYMTANPPLTLKQVALRTGIPYQQVRNKANKERWSAVRVREQMDALKNKRQEFLRQMAGEAISFDQVSIDLAKLGQGIVVQRLIEISKLTAANAGQMDELVHRIRNGEAYNRKETYGMASYSELVGLAQAAKMFQEIGRTALGSEVTDGTILAGDDPSIERIVSISEELGKDDPARIAAFVEALERAGMAVLDLEDHQDEEAADDEEHVVVLEGNIVDQPAIEGPKNDG